MFIVEDHMGLFREERSTNVTPTKEAWKVNSEENTRIFSSTNGAHMAGVREVNLEENTKISEGMEEGGPSTNVKRWKKYARGPTMLLGATLAP